MMSHALPPALRSLRVRAFPLLCRLSTRRTYLVCRSCRPGTPCSSVTLNSTALARSFLAISSLFFTRDA
nr:ORF4 [Lake Sinai virus 3]